MNHQWNSIKSMHHARDGFTSLSFDGKLYIFGGSKLNSAEVYNPATNSWTLLPPMKKARVGCGCAMIDGKIYVVGGLDEHDRSLNCAEVFDVKTCKWKVLGKRMKGGRSGCAAIAVGKELFVFGGSSTGIAEVYHTGHRFWTPFPDNAMTMSTSTPGLTSSLYSLPYLHLHNKLIYVVGGYNANSDSVISSMRVYDTSTGHWTANVYLDLNRWGCGTFFYKNALIHVGGVTLGPNRTSKSLRRPLDSALVLRLGPRYQKLRQKADIDFSIPPLTEKRAGCAAMIIDKKLFVLGGHDGFNFLSSGEVLDLPDTLPVNSNLANSNATAPFRTMSQGDFNEEEGDESVCCICLDRPKSHAFVPCGHLSVCDECATKSSLDCPICRNRAGVFFFSFC
eukprot:237760_1